MTMVVEKAKTDNPVTRPGHYIGLDFSVSELESCTQGLNYPTDRQGIIRQATINDSSDDVMAFLKILPLGSYYHFNDIANTAWDFLIV